MMLAPGTVSLLLNDPIRPCQAVRVVLKNGAWEVWTRVRNGEGRRQARLALVTHLVLTECTEGPKGATDGVVAGYWNLAGAWKLDASGAHGEIAWPFGDAPSLGLVRVFGPDGVVTSPQVPSIVAAEAWVAAQNFVCPPWDCNCGAVHADGGPVVGFFVRDMLHIGGTSARLVVRPPHGSHRESLLEVVLPLQVCVLLDVVEVGGRTPKEHDVRSTGEA